MKVLQSHPHALIFHDMFSIYLFRQTDFFCSGETRSTPYSRARNVFALPSGGYGSDAMTLSYKNRLTRFLAAKPFARSKPPRLSAGVLPLLAS